MGVKTALPKSPDRRRPNEANTANQAEDPGPHAAAASSARRPRCCPEERPARNGDRPDEQRQGRRRRQPETEAGQKPAGGSKPKGGKGC